LKPYKVKKVYLIYTTSLVKTTTYELVRTQTDVSLPFKLILLG
jgi:hypothetical protein